MLVIPLLLAFLAQDAPSMEDLIRRLSAEGIEDRENAAKAIVDSWKKWTEADLAALRKQGEKGTGESAARARSMAATIDLLRSIPEEIWKICPRVGTVMRESIPRDLGEMLQELDRRWEKGEVSDKALATLAVGLLRDTRQTGISTGPVRHLGEWILTVAELAEYCLFDCLHFIPPTSSPAEYLAWWKANGSKTEKEWNLAALDNPEQRVRAEAVARLARMKDPALYPRLFKVLQGVEEEYAFELAAKGLAAVPQDALGPALKPYLDDRRFEVRLHAAKLLFPSMKRAAIDAVIDAFDRPDRLEYAPAESWEVASDVFNWFVEIQDERALDVIYRTARSTETMLKWEAVEALGGVKGLRAESILLEAFDEPDYRPGCLYGWNGLELDAPRLCDLAGVILSIKMKIEKEFTWPASLRERDRNLEAIGNRWRKAHGRPEKPFAGPGVALVPAEKVAALAADLTHDSAENRAAGIRGLSLLGPGAWRPVQALISESRGVAKERLEAALKAWTRTVRSVTARSDAAIPYAAALNRRQHRTLDFAALRDEVIRPWFDDATQTELVVECRRGFDGPGITLVIEGVRGADRGVPRSILQSYEPSGGGVMDYDWAKLEKALEELKSNRRALEEEFEEPASFKLRLEKWYPPK